MSIPFTCPHCGAQTDVAEEYAGQSGPCAACGQGITVPPLAGTPGYAAPTPSSPAILIVALVLIVALGAVLICGGALFFVAVGRSVTPMPATTATVASAPASSGGCLGNLQRIGLALHSYHAAHGTFPPAYLADKGGKPVHSWRVLLLPYLDHKPLFDQYRFDEPWDSSYNLSLADAMDEVYRCPADQQSDPRATSYVMIVGPDTISDGPTAHSLSDIKDGKSDTMLVLEVANSGIKWSEPRDLDVKDLAFQLNGSGAGIQSNHSGKVNALFAGGSIRMLDGSTSPENLRAMATIAGGEAVQLP